MDVADHFRRGGQGAPGRALIFQETTVDWGNLPPIDDLIGSAPA